MSRRRWALPIARLVVATNVNDILHRALTSGDYSAGTVTPTATPSMDIQVSSNFERLLFDLSGRDGGAITGMMGEFDTNRAMTIPADMLSGARGLFSSASIDGDAMSLALRWAQEKGGQVIDPHSAVGLAAARQLEIDADIPVVTLATAHPGEVPRGGRAGNRRAPGAARAPRQSLRPRGTLYQAARRL